MSHIPSRVLRALKGQNPDDMLIVDGHKTTLGEFVTDNWDDDYGPLEEIDDVLALREGQSTRIPGFVGGSTTVKRMERTASRMVVKPNPKEISRGEVVEISRGEVVGDVHYTTVSRPQADGTIMVAIVLIPSGEVIFHDYVEDRSKVSPAIREMLRNWNKLGFPSQMANRSRKRPGEKMSGRSASYWGDRVATLMNGRTASQDWAPSHRLFKQYFGSSVPDDWTEIPTPDDVRVAAWYSVDEKGRYALFILTPRDKKADYALYRSEDDVFKAVDRKVQEYRAAQDRAKARNEALRKSIQDLEANIGDILVSSWGYDQTNVDFYEVVATTGSMVTIREIAKKAVSDDGVTAKVIPVPGRFVGPPMKKKIKPSYNGYSVKVRSFANAYVWSGKPVYETGAYAGH